MAFTAEQPAGPDLSFDPEFEEVAREVGKLQQVDGGRPNWAQVEALSDRLLAERTKDYRLVAWSLVAKVQARGWAGLAAGLAQYQEVVASSWEVMHPPVRRLKARVNLHEWVTELAVPVLDGRAVARGEEEAVRTAARVLDELDPLLAQRFENAYPGSTRLRGVLKRAIDALPRELPREVVLEAPVAGPAGSARDPFVTADPFRVYDPHVSLAPIRDQLLGAAEAMVLSDPASARGYQARRLGLMLGFDPYPRELPPRQRLADVVRTGIWLDVLTAAEKAVVECPAWLDAHRFVVESMAKLGARYNEARHLVQSEAAALVVRHPTLLGEHFSDGSPVADARTQEWIRQEVRSASGASAMMSNEDEEAERRLASVRQLSLQGRVSEAVALAIGLANRAGDPRGRFRGFLVAGQTAMDAGKAAVARPLLEGLLEHVERHQLEVWEPALCVTLYASLVACLRALGTSDSKEQELFDKLCRLDPAAAMGLETAAGTTAEA